MSQAKDDASYGVGMSIAQSLENQNLNANNLEKFGNRMKAVFSKTEQKINHKK